MSRAGVQVLADRLGIRLLHIKGETVDPAVTPKRRLGTDVDVLVDPREVGVFDRALKERGWSVYSTFDNGSSFGHAQTYFHGSWGHLDLHRRFPGIGIADADAFELLWRDRGAREVAGIICPVPGIDAQRVIQILNGARNGVHGGPDDLWSTMDLAAQTRCLLLSRRLDADVAFAAGAGALDAYAHRPEHRLWKVTTEGGTRTEEWRARVIAARTLPGRVGVLVRAPLVNIDVLAHRLGRRPGVRDVAVEFLRRARRGLAELRRRG